MKIRPWIIGALIGALALTLLPLSGLLPPQATGPDGVGAWYRSLATRQSVTLRALAVAVPDLQGVPITARAAGHYQRVCAGCHGSPDAPPERLALDLRPEPPLLAQGHWRSPGYQFQIIRHGLRNSAMPAWPALDRRDEIWEMVALLRALPDLSAADYRRLAGDGSCAGCHGERGEGRSGVPRLDIQTPDYLAAALRSYRAGDRQSGAMRAAAQRLSDEEIDTMSRRFGQVSAPETGRDGAVADLARRGDPGRDIPACLSCHGPEVRRDYPRLLGQDAGYLRLQLGLFRDLGVLRGGQHAAVMAPIAARLSPSEIEALAEWLSGGP